MRGHGTRPCACRGRQQRQSARSWHPFMRCRDRQQRQSARPWRLPMRLPGRATAAKRSGHSVCPCACQGGQQRQNARPWRPSMRLPGWAAAAIPPGGAEGAARLRSQRERRILRFASAVHPRLHSRSACALQRVYPYGTVLGMAAFPQRLCLACVVCPLRCFFSPSPAATPPPKRPRSRARGGFAPRPARDPPRSAADRK